MQNTQPIAQQSQKEIDLEMKVIQLLHELRVPTNLLGQRLLREAVLSVYKNPGSSYTKKIYPDIAQMFSTNPSCVERNIRHAIQYTWDKGNRDMLRPLFPGHSVTDLPSNARFISGLAEEIEVRELRGKQAKSQLRGGHRISME